MNIHDKKQGYCVSPKKDVVMIVKVTAKCINCGHSENLYVDEKQKDIIEYKCSECDCNKYRITYR